MLKKAIAQKIHRENFCALAKIHENRETFLSLNFCRLRYIGLGADREPKVGYIPYNGTENSHFLFTEVQMQPQCTCQVEMVANSSLAPTVHPSDTLYCIRHYFKSILFSNVLKSIASTKINLFEIKPHT